MNQQPAITPALPEDVPALAALINSAYRGESARQGWTTEADLLDGIRTSETALTEALGQKGSVILKYINETGQLTGCVFLQKQDQHLYLGMLTVSPDKQARGIGKQLLMAAENHARQHDCSIIYMTVISVREELIAWYQRHGYRQNGERQPFPNDPRFGIPKQPLEFILMEKKLIATTN